MEPQIFLKSQKSAKIDHKNAPTVKTCKKTPSGRGQTIKINDGYTLSTVFSEAHGSQKRLKMEAKMEPQGIGNHKNHEKRALQKTLKNKTAKSESLCAFGLQNGSSCSRRFRPQIHKKPRKPQNGPPGLQNEPLGLQNNKKHMIRSSQNLENPIARLLKNGTVAGYARSALDIYICIYSYIT